MQLVQLWDLLPWQKHVTKMGDCGGALAKLVLRKMHTKTSLMKLKFSARKAVHDCYQCWKFELKISSDSGDMHFSAIKPRWGGCPPLNLGTYQTCTQSTEKVNLDNRKSNNKQSNNIHTYIHTYITCLKPDRLRNSTWTQVTTQTNVLSWKKAQKSI